MIFTSYTNYFPKQRMPLNVSDGAVFSVRQELKFRV